MFQRFPNVSRICTSFLPRDPIRAFLRNKLSIQVYPTMIANYINMPLFVRISELAWYPYQKYARYLVSNLTIEHHKHIIKYHKLIHRKAVEIDDVPIQNTISQPS